MKIFKTCDRDTCNTFCDPFEHRSRHNVMYAKKIHYCPQIRLPFSDL